jgi:flagellum-specific ATP synthase
MQTGIDFSAARDRISDASPIRLDGKVSRVIGLTIESVGPSTSLGEICKIHRRQGGAPLRAEVVGFKEHLVLLMPYGDLEGINPGSRVEATGNVLRVPVGAALLGRVVNGVGEPLDDLGAIDAESMQPVTARAPHPLKRRRITEQMITGIRAIDTFAAAGKGQRLGIFAGSGVGKSVLLGMIARGSKAKINVIALIGERGREVREFIERDLGEEGLKRAIVVAVTADEPALMKIKGVMTATAIAEYFRAQGEDVILMLDSVTRIAMAQREIGLAVGEPPATKGYTPSVFAMLPKFLERAGAAENGSITGLYTILVEGDDFNEPISDAVRSILDGHVTLSRRLAQRRHYPAIDILQSISRVMIDIVPEQHLQLSSRARQILACYSENEDLINIGAYVRGSSGEIDNAIAKVPQLNRFLQQGMQENATDLTSDLGTLAEIIGNEEIPLPAAEATTTAAAPQTGATEKTGQS